MRLNDVVVGMLALASSLAWVGCGSDNTTGPSGPQPAPGPWLHQAGGAGDDFGTGVAVDGSGNVWVTGFFAGDAAFGGTTLTGVGGNDAFVAKYDVNGKALWARSAGGTLSDFGTALAVDGSGDVVVTGSFHGDAMFGTTMLTSAGVYDVFVAKYDAAGTLLWARSVGGTNDDIGYGVAIDKSGNIAVTGYFVDVAVFGGTTLTSAGSGDMFVAKFSAGGTLLWAHSAGGATEDYGNGVAVDGSGNVAVTGAFAGDATFGTTTLSAAGVNDIFTAKYDAGGTLLWVRPAGGTGNDYGNHVAVDRSGHVVVAGTFQGSAMFGTTTITSAGGDDMFVARYDAGGTLQWVRSAGGANTEYATSAAVDGSGNVVVTGSMEGNAAFGVTSLISAGGSDVFVVKYDAGGAVQWARSAGGTFDDIGYGVAIDGSGRVVATGGFGDTATFGTTTITTAGNNDAFIVRMNKNGF